MPVVALVLFAVFGLLGFGWRSWLQRRRTGSTGFHGISGRVGSVEWFAGVGFVVAMAAAVFAPALQLAGLVSPLSFLHAPWIQLTGIVLAVVGIAATVYAQVDMGDSWRIGVDPTETTTLVRKGVFGFVRNPIFTAMLIFGLGIALVTPNMVAIVGFVLLVLTIEVQVRAVEEPYLSTKHGDAYRDYCAGVGTVRPGRGAQPLRRVTPREPRVRSRPARSWPTCPTVPASPRAVTATRRVTPWARSALPTS